MSFDMERAQELALDVWKYKQGELVSVMIHLGDRLGLYRALAGRGPTAAGQLANALNLDERWVAEWLLGQAAAGLLEREATGMYVLTDEAAAVLVDEESLLCAIGAFVGGTPPEDIARVADSFRTGRGFTYGDMGMETAAQIDRMNAPWLKNFLIPVVVAQLEGVAERLAAGGRMADVGCGGGVALEAFAEAFPDATLVGVDPSAPATERARLRLGGRTNVTIYDTALEDTPETEPFDLITTLDCMHDMPRPDVAAVTIKQQLADEGVWLIKDMKCAPVFEDNLRNPLLAMQYGYSIISCLPSGTSTADGMALGTMGFHPEKAREIARGAGFGSLRVLDTPDPAHLYYEVRH